MQDGYYGLLSALDPISLRKDIYLKNSLSFPKYQNDLADPTA